MACYHFHLDQISRGKGKSAVAAAAYRSGTRLANSYYGEISDYTKKGGVLLSEIHLPPHAPERFADRETLWNEVEWTEKNGRAQLANNFEIALMNEFTMEENIGLARRFVEEQLVARGMTADLCIHDPGRKEGQPPNPHMHILTPIRPLKEDGTWGPKEKKVPVLDADGSPVTGKNGNPKYRAVSTTGWTSKETLEELRKAWADLCNEMYQKKGLSISVDHRSYEARGIDQIPTVHEGARVRAMEEKGIRTMLGDLNRMIRKLNRMLKKAKEALAVIGDAKETIIEAMKEKEAPTLGNYLLAELERRNAVAEGYRYGRNKAICTNMKTISEMAGLLEDEGIITVDDLEGKIRILEDEMADAREECRKLRDSLKKTKEHLKDYEDYRKLQPVYQEYESRIFFKETFREKHKKEISRYKACERRLKGLCNSNGKVPVKKWEKKIAEDPERIRDLESRLQELRGRQYSLQKIMDIVDALRKETEMERLLSAEPQKKEPEIQISQPKKKKRSHGMEL